MLMMAVVCASNLVVIEVVMVVVVVVVTESIPNHEVGAVPKKEVERRRDYSFSKEYKMHLLL